MVEEAWLEMVFVGGCDGRCEGEGLTEGERSEFTEEGGAEEDGRDGGGDCKGFGVAADV